MIASGGIRVVQMFTGLRIAASETLGNDRTDLTVYPVLAFGVHVRPDRLIGIFAESDLAGGITTRDIGDTALLGYASVGVTLTFDRLWSHGR